MKSVPYTLPRYGYRGTVIMKDGDEPAQAAIRAVLKERRSTRPGPPVVFPCQVKLGHDTYQVDCPRRAHLIKKRRPGR